MSIRLKIILFLAILFSVSIANSLFSVLLENNGEEKLAWVNHTHEVLNVKERLLSVMKDAETGQRGYLLTGRTTYLEPYHSGVQEAKLLLIQLKKLTSDNPEHQKALISIEKNIKLKFDELALTIQLSQEGKRSKALQVVKENKGKQYMDDIRTQFISFKNRELVLLEKRKGDFREHRARITTLIVVEFVFLIFLGIITIIFLQKNFFAPLALLLSSTKKIEEGNKLEIFDVVDKDEMGHLLSTFFVMSEKIYKRTQTLDHKAHHDGLTGLKNRVKLIDEIQDSIDGLDSYEDKVAVFFLDLNSFKRVNDTLGHDVGDHLLKETAIRLKAAVRGSDAVFRLGGDEFIVLAKNVKQSSDVRDIAAKILQHFEPSTRYKEYELEISLSIGIAIAPDDSSNSDEILKYADLAMYTAKRAKNTSYQLFDKSMLNSEDIAE